MPDINRCTPLHLLDRRFVVWSLYSVEGTFSILNLWSGLIPWMPDLLRSAIEWNCTQNWKQLARMKTNIIMAHEIYLYLWVTRLSII